MFAAVKIHNLKQSRTIAGMWSEGLGKGDDSGTRQYSMLMNMPTYDSQYIRDLSDEEILKLHESAHISELNN